MRIAYLTNLYPAVSHSFIRREIIAVEAAGATVDRYSIRPNPGTLPDPTDQREKALTTVILTQGGAALLGAFLRTLFGKPARTIAALKAAISMGLGGPAKLFRHLIYLVEACWLARHLTDADHLHAHFGTNPAAVARLVHILTGLPYSFTVHGPDEFDDPRGLSLGAKIADARYVMAISSYGRSQLMRWSDPADWPKIVVARCGIDAGFITDPTPAPAAPNLCCVARLSAQKGLPLLIDAAAELAHEGVDFTLTLVGDGELRPQIERRIADQGLGHRIRLTGYCSGQEVRAHIAASRAMVLPSFAEGLPVVIMEALVLGRPVVTTAIAGIPELVDGECGWVVPAGSVDALKSAIRDALAADPQDLTRMGEIGRRRVLERHDAAAIGRDLVALFGAEA
ncbi:glycosyltransferase family 4 protein [Sphingomonas sp. ID0503]|uniref:glycosyltransferase family 4 protein n=1 Tax=Sphingomonas sp. ID0503 TaxID=3399691 RepID=UPI003AFAE821